MDRHKIVSDQLKGIIEILGNRPLEKSWKSILKEAIKLIDGIEFDKLYYLDNYTLAQWIDWVSSGCRKYMVKPEGINAACNWIECQHGCGLAGMGICSARGTWWKKKCKSFELIENLK